MPVLVNPISGDFEENTLPQIDVIQQARRLRVGTGELAAGCATIRGRLRLQGRRVGDDVRTIALGYRPLIFSARSASEPVPGSGKLSARNVYFTSAPLVRDGGK